MPFKDRTMQGMYEACRKAVLDNWSEFYHARTTAGPSPMGPNAPRRGAGHRCGFWDGWYGVMSLYGKGRGTLGYAAWKAGKDARKKISK